MLTGQHRIFRVIWWSGNVLLAVNKDREFPGGAAVEVTVEAEAGEWKDCLLHPA